MKLFDLILENKLTDALNKYQQVNPDAIRQLYNGDPTGTKKYFEWMIKQAIIDVKEEIDLDDLIKNIKLFDENVNRITPDLLVGHDISDNVLMSPKDINRYSLRDLYGVVGVLKQTKSKSEVKKEGADKIYEDDRWLVIAPKTHDASCYYGSGTRWCTTSKGDPGHFNKYTSEGSLIYFLDKTKTEGYLYKMALYVRWDKEAGDLDWTWFDDRDSDIGNNDVIKALLPTDLVNELQSYIQDKFREKIEYERQQARLRWERERAEQARQEEERLRGDEKLPLLRVAFGDEMETTPIEIEYLGNWENTIKETVPDPIVNGLNVIKNVFIYYGNEKYKITHFKITMYSFVLENQRSINGTFDIEFDDDLNKDPQRKEFEIYIPYHYLRDENHRRGHITFPDVRTPEGLAMMKELKNFVVKQLKTEAEIFIENIDVMQQFNLNKRFSHYSSMVFKYPPKKGSMTDLFMKYLIHRQRKGLPATKKDFYKKAFGYTVDVSKLSREEMTDIFKKIRQAEGHNDVPDWYYTRNDGYVYSPRLNKMINLRGHNTTFFGALSSSGIVNLDGKYYTLGPNYMPWKEGRLKKL